MDTPALDPAKTQVMITSVLGATLVILFRRDADKVSIATTFISAGVADYYFARPLWVLAHTYFPWCDDQWQGPIGFLVGLLAMFVIGAVVKLGGQFMADPLATAKSIFDQVLQRILPSRNKEG